MRSSSETTTSAASINLHAAGGVCCVVEGMGVSENVGRHVDGFERKCVEPQNPKAAAGRSLETWD